MAIYKVVNSKHQLQTSTPKINSDKKHVFFFSNVRNNLLQIICNITCVCSNRNNINTNAFEKTLGKQHDILSTHISQIRWRHTGIEGIGSNAQVEVINTGISCILTNYQNVTGCCSTCVSWTLFLFVYRRGLGMNISR